MKKRMISLLCVACLVFSITSVAHANDTVGKDPTYTITTPYEYPVTPDMDEWKEFESHLEMIDACQIPEEILEHMSTEALAETVMNYPLLPDMLAWSDRSLGFEHVASYFNGLEELMSRKNGVDALLNTTPGHDSRGVLEEKEDYLGRNKIRCATVIVANANGDEMLSARTLPSIETGEVFTPNGSLVPYYKDLDFTELNHLFGSGVPFTQTEFDDLERYYAVTYPNATKIDGISPSYNCHTYAWHSTSESPYWITNIDNYVLDGSYSEIPNNEAAQGDVVLYWQTRRAYNHSALVRSYSNGHFNLRSKWDFMGVYSHREDYCPYYSGIYDIVAYAEN